MTNPLSGGVGNTGKPEIGENGVLEFIDEINARRAHKGNRERYQPTRIDGKLTGTPVFIGMKVSAHTPSPTYARARLVHSKPDGDND